MKKIGVNARSSPAEAILWQKVARQLRSASPRVSQSSQGRKIKTCAPNLATTAGKYFIFFILYVAVPITIFIAIVMRVS